MATVLEQAKRGQRKAMLEVYQGCKQKVHYVSLLLTGQEDSTNLDGDYAVFGYVTQGMDVVDAICEAAQPSNPPLQAQGRLGPEPGKINQSWGFQRDLP